MFYSICRFHCTKQPLTSVSILDTDYGGVGGNKNVIKICHKGQEDAKGLEIVHDIIINDSESDILFLVEGAKGQNL